MCNCLLSFFPCMSDNHSKFTSGSKASMLHLKICFLQPSQSQLKATPFSVRPSLPNPPLITAVHLQAATPYMQSSSLVVSYYLIPVTSHVYDVFTFIRIQILREQGFDVCLRNTFPSSSVHSVFSSKNFVFPFTFRLISLIYIGLIIYFSVWYEVESSVFPLF